MSEARRGTFGSWRGRHDERAVLWRYALRLTGDAAKPNVVQETLLRRRVAASGGDRRHAAGRAWLFTVARLAHDHRRAAQRPVPQWSHDRPITGTPEAVDAGRGERRTAGSLPDMRWPN